MKWALLALIVGLLLAAMVAQSTEYFTDPEFTSGGKAGVASGVQRPCECTGATCSDAAGGCRQTTSIAWASKIESLAPIGYKSADYLAVLQAFYDNVYSPATTKPTEAQVDTFLASSAGTVAGVDRASVKAIIIDGFHIDRTGTAAGREEKSQMFKPSDANLAPDMGRDELRTRTEGGYSGVNPTSSTRFSEGDYGPVKQSMPNKPGQWDDGSMMWKGPRPASVCPCAENIM